jgi:hypothetical protein
MKSQIIVVLVVLVVVAAHVALYRWVKFKIHEGVILQFLRDAEKVWRFTLTRKLKAVGVPAELECDLRLQQGANATTPCRAPSYEAEGLVVGWAVSCRKPT